MLKNLMVFIVLTMFLFACQSNLPTKSLYDSTFGTRTVGSTIQINPGSHDHHHRYLRRGWSLAEGEATWCSDKISRCIFYILHPKDISITIHSRPLSNLSPPQTFVLKVNDFSSRQFEMKDNFNFYHISIPANHLHSGWNLLSFEFSRIDRPSNLGLGPDNRHLTALVKSIRFTPSKLSHGQYNTIKSGEKWIGPDSMLLLTVNEMKELTCFLDVSAPKKSGKLTAKIIVDQDQGNAFSDEQSITFKEHKRIKLDWKLQSKFPARLRIINTSNQSIHIDGYIGAVQKLSYDNPQNQPFAEHVIVLTPDACATDYLGCYGHPESYTPFIDRLAKNSFQYSSVYSSAAYTVTGVAGMFTGQRPDYHDVRQIGEKLSENAITIAEKLQNKGYRTLAFSCMPTVATAWNFHQGFDQFVEFFQSRNNPIHTSDILDELFEHNPFHPNSRFFTYIHIREPHAPYHPLYPFKKIWGDISSDIGDIDNLRNIDTNGIDNDGDPINQIRSLYLSQIAEMDKLAETIYQEAETKISKPFRFVITSDHGEAFGEHGRLTHNSTLYSEMIRVPALVHQSDNSLVKIIDTLQSNMDLELFLKRTPEFNQRQYVWHRTAGSDWYFTGITGKRFRYIYGGYYPITELYDRNNDPAERHNIALDYPVMRDHYETIRQQRTLIKPGTNVIESNDSELHKKLKSLGYIE